MKAFNTLDHTVLLHKLEWYEVRDIVLNWFQSYLAGRSLVTKIQDNRNTVVYSDYYNITCGTAQGSCLGPLLFILFVNDIYMQPILEKLILFVDDMTLLESHKNRRFLNYVIQHDLAILINWFCANKLSLNMTKTVVIDFWPCKTNHTEDMILMG